MIIVYEKRTVKTREVQLRLPQSARLNQRQMPTTEITEDAENQDYAASDELTVGGLRPRHGALDCALGTLCSLWSTAFIRLKHRLHSDDKRAWLTNEIAVLTEGEISAVGIFLIGQVGESGGDF